MWDIERKFKGKELSQRRKGSDKKVNLGLETQAGPESWFYQKGSGELQKELKQGHVMAW